MRDEETKGRRDQREQERLPFDWRFKERQALIRSLELPLAYLGPDQSAAVIDLLERVLLAAVRSDDGLTSHARKSYLAAGLEGRRTVSERTIQTWSSWAEELALLNVDRRSQKWGGSRPNVWQINEARLRELTKCPGGGKKPGGSREEGTSAPGEKRLPPHISEREREIANRDRSIGERGETGTDVAQSPPLGPSPVNADPPAASRTAPTRTRTARASRGKPLDVSGVDWDRVLWLAAAIGRKIPPQSDADRRAWLRYAVLVESEALSEAWLFDAIEAVARGETKTTRQKHFVAVLRAKAEEAGIDAATLFGMAGRIEIPLAVWKSPALEVRR